MVIHALVDQDATGGVEVEGVAEDAALEVAGAEGTLLQECGGEAAFSEGGKGPGRVVAQDDDSVGEIDFKRSGFKGEDATEGLPADLVGHVVRVGEGTDDDLAVPVSPPSDDGAPAVQGGVPGDDYDVVPVSPARKAAWRELGTKGHRGRPGVAKSSRTPRMKTAASETMGGRGMTLSKSGSDSVPMTEEKREVKGRT